MAILQVLRFALEIVVRELEMEGAFFLGFPFSEGRIPPRFLISQTSSDLARGCFRFPLIDKAGAKITDLIVVPRDGKQLSLEESDFLESLAVQTAVAIENARQHERLIHLERVEQDLASARAIQRSLLPHLVHGMPGFKAGMRSVSCHEVGGDYLDVMPLPSGEYIMIVADVAGKGLASAMVASSFRAAFRAMVTAGVPFVNVALQLNALHFAEGIEAQRRYVTALFLRLNPEFSTLEVLNAGHNPGVLLSGNQKKPVLLEASGTPIGLLPLSQYTYTDGLTEIFRGEDEFGLQRLSETFRTCVEKDGEAVLNHIWRTIEEFGTEQE
jgi:phosphoserine phosphatase RsbU/P